MRAAAAAERPLWPGAPLSPDLANRLARRMQAGVPLVGDPFDTLADQLGCDPGAVLDQVRRWQSEGLLREISAILEGAALGYDSALVAAAVPADEVDAVAEIVNLHPTVTHNYLRTHDYNLWFTIAVPREMGLEQHLALLGRDTGIPRFGILRRTHTFKIGVNFDLQTRANATQARPLGEAAPIVLDERARRILRALQVPLPLSPRPFAELAAQAGVPERDLLAYANRHLGGAIRKYVATFHHRRLGVRGNGMAVWNVPSEDLTRLGPVLTQAPEVSHCYARSTIEGFPYALYSMLHAPNEDACREVARRLSREIEVDDYLVLFSRTEYKKCRLRYFLPELDAWWEQRRG